MIGLIITVLAIALGIFLFLSMPKKKKFMIADLSSIQEVLQERVSYYKKLSAGEKLRFEKEIVEFLKDITQT